MGMNKIYKFAWVLKRILGFLVFFFLFFMQTTAPTNGETDTVSCEKLFFIESNTTVSGACPCTDFYSSSLGISTGLAGKSSNVILIKCCSIGGNHQPKNQK